MNSSHWGFIQNCSWKTNISLETFLGIMEKLYSDARYDYDKQEQRIDEEATRTIAVGRRYRGEEFRLYPLDNFWQRADPLSLIQENDVCLSLFTPHYQLNGHNLTRKDGEIKELPLSIDYSELKNIYRRPIKEGVNRMEVSAYFNVSEIIAEIAVGTSPAVTKDNHTKMILTHYIDQLLTSYPKPQKLN